MSDTRKPHQAAKTTIVGGQPPGNDRELATVPVGLEELLGMAAVDDAFAEALLKDSEAAVQASGVKLTPTEASILKAMNGAALLPMIAQVRSSLPEPERRAFLEQAASAVALLVGAGAVLAATGCKSGSSGTARNEPNKAPKKGRKPTPRELADTGARPDRPPARDDAGVKPMGRPRPDIKETRPNRGIRPRRPQPDELRRTTGIAPDRPLKRNR